jgi:chaperone protein DnaJ
MVADTKLYDLLGVAPSCSENDLKRAFKKKAFELHPDRNKEDPKATEKFQAVNEAYEILKDPHKRQQYDQFGLEACKNGMGQAGSNIFDFFFGPRGFPGFGRNGGKNRRARTQDIAHELKVSLEDLYNGKETTLKINRNIICPDCHGNGCLPGKNPITCSDCKGQGQKVQVTRMGPMITQQVTTCPTCKGEGKSINSNDRCKTCKGQKVSTEDKKIVVHIERGMEDGDQIRFQGCSDELPGADTGDLIVIIREKKHSTFIRKHDDLLIKKKITLSQALLGTSFPIHHLDGRILVVETPNNKVISPNSVKVIEREGMPNRGNSYSQGKLYVAFEVVFPEKSNISLELINTLIKTLPPPDELKGVNFDDENVYKCTLNDSDLSKFENSKRNQSQGRKEAYQSRDDDEHEGAQMGCQPM